MFIKLFGGGPLGYYYRGGGFEVNCYRSAIAGSIFVPRLLLEGKLNKLGLMFIVALPLASWLII